MGSVLARLHPAGLSLLVVVFDVLDVRHESREVLDHLTRLGVAIRLVVEVVTHVPERDLLLAPLPGKDPLAGGRGPTTDGPRSRP